MAEKRLTKKIAEQFLADDESVDLQEFTELDDDAAASLSKCEEWLFLNGLATLSDAAAESLSKHGGGTIVLDGVTSLSDAAAESLGKHNGTLSLNGLKTLSDVAAESLSTYVGQVNLMVSNLPESAAAILRSKKLTKEIVKQLYADGFPGNICEFASIDDAAAEYLSKLEDGLYLHGLTSLSDAAAESLSKHKGELVLNGLATLSDAAAESLGNHKGNLDLMGLTSLSDTAAESLSKHEGALQLTGLTSLSDAAAESFSKHDGWLGLFGLTSLSEAAVESLCEHQGELKLTLDGLPESVAQSFRDCKANVELREVWNAYQQQKPVADSADFAAGYNAAKETVSIWHQ